MKNRIKHLLLVLTAVNALNLTAQEKKSPHALPWMAHTNQLLYLVYHLDAALVKPFLPNGVRPKANDEGLVSAGVEFYAVDRAFGQGLGGVAFLFVEVEDYTSSSGTPGHWPIWGAVSSETSHKIYTETFGFPFSLSPDFKFDLQAGVYSGILYVEGKEILSYSGQTASANAYKMESNVLMIGAKNDQLVKSTVPFINEGRNIQLDHLRIQASGIPALELLANKAPIVTYLVQNGYFSYSKAEYIKPPF